MKKLMIGFMVLVMCSIVLISTEENPFDSFMGMKWGINAAEFKANFKYKVRSYSEGFVLDNFPLGSLVIKSIGFTFINIGPVKNMKFKEKNYSQFSFSKVFMLTTPDQFESLLEIFTKKYGKPIKSKDSKIQNRMGAEFSQSIVYWENGERAISLYRYGNTIDKGFAVFASAVEIRESIDKDKEENEKAADIL